MTLSSRHLRDVSDDERQVSFLGADQLLGRAVELFGRETFEGLEVRFVFSVMSGAPSFDSCFSKYSNGFLWS